MIEFVSATRADPDEYKKSSPLGWSLRRLKFNPNIASRVATSNTEGLATVYNRAIDADNEHDVLVFIHDDVYIDDYFVAQRVMEGLKAFDVVGVAGNRRRVPGQHAWAFVKGTEWDHKYLSGFIAHGGPANSGVDPYGPVPAACELLDGVFIAVRKSKLRESGVRFDERFKFHFYDMDFCRTARQAGLRLGTWPIAITHASAGRFGTEVWQAARDVYFEKWGD